MYSSKAVKSVIAIVMLAATPVISFAQGITMGNGDKNWINVENVKRDGTVLTFSEVQIDGDGWLVIHPFEEGAPNGDKYVASTFLKDGQNSNVEIEVFKGLAPGEMFIVMLHSDSNANEILDFVFVDDQNVMDLAVFEGNKMIGHAIPTP
ncbi:MAG: hypothetical protein AB8B95_15880 [Pseudohongiellaceae bacterium]